jgi:hypothetical protein
MLVMLVEACKGRARCASFIQSVCSRREASLRQRKIPRSRVLSALLPQASIRVSNTLHRVLHNSTAAPTYPSLQEGRGTETVCAAELDLLYPGFGSPQNHPSSAGYGDFDLLLADYLHVDDRSILAYQVTSPEHYPLADRSNIQVCLLVA